MGLPSKPLEEIIIKTINIKKIPPLVVTEETTTTRGKPGAQTTPATDPSEQIDLD
jgi:hypothetical protein